MSRSSSPLPASASEAVKQLATNLRRLEQYRRQRVAFAEQLSRLQDANLVTVSGEAALLETVDSRLAEASTIIDELEYDKTTIDDALSRLREISDGYEWDVVDDVMAELRTKLEHQDGLIRSWQTEIDDWTSRLEQVRLIIDEALDIRAPVARERATVDAMAGLAQIADRALSDRRYIDVHDPLRRLQAVENTPEKITETVRAKIVATQRFSGRAEILLLHSVVDDLHAYTVLLRTPSEVGTHGFSIQDSSSLVDQDRQYIGAAISQITRAVDLGIARAFGRNPAGSDQQPQPRSGAVRDLVPSGSLPGKTTPEDLPTLVGDVGKVMFRLIAPDRMRQYISDNPCSLTITTDDLELPWELMYDESLESSAADAGRGFLCLQRPIARMPMGRAFPRTRPVTRQKAKLRFLLIHADPEHTLAAAEREIDKIKSALEPGNQGSNYDIEVTTLRGEQVTGRELNKALLGGDYDVIHFAGHAAFTESNPDLSGLVLHNQERFLSQKIQRIVEGQPLIFLNACQTGRTANAEEPQKVGEYFWKPAEGLASAFLYGGALGCVGSLWPVYDDPAAEFAIEFYNHVLDGHMLGEAMRLARWTTREKHPDSITWASFVLYGDPTFRLVR